MWQLFGGQASGLTQAQVGSWNVMMILGFHGEVVDVMFPVMFVLCFVLVCFHTLLFFVRSFGELGLFKLSNMHLTSQCFHTYCFHLSFVSVSGISRDHTLYCIIP